MEQGEDVKHYGDITKLNGWELSIRAEKVLQGICV